MPTHFFPFIYIDKTSGRGNKSLCWEISVHACMHPVFLNAREFRLRVFREFSNEKPKAPAYQSFSKAKEGLTQDAKWITETIKSCDMDEGLNT
jgi:hypothetical protein